MITRVDSTISVLVPTYLRPQDLSRCLGALETQVRPPEELVVVVRDTDHPTRDLLNGLTVRAGTLRMVTVTEPGVVAAMNAGLRASSGEIVALTDDDAAPRPEWLSRIEAHFRADPRVGGVGGRDWVHQGERIIVGAKPVVGRVQWFGRVIGNHHLGVGGPRGVDVLKGVNCAYRRSAIREIGFDTRLLGSGAQVYWELSLGLQLRRRRWKLIYDPAIEVDHFWGARFDEARVSRLEAKAETLAVYNAAYNEALILSDHLKPWPRVAYRVWSALIGASETPGLLQAVRFTPTHGAVAWRRFAAAQRGKMRCFFGSAGGRVGVRRP